jgi:hypothetical protein
MPQFDFFIYSALVFFTLIIILFLYIYTTKSIIVSTAEQAKIRAKFLSIWKKKYSFLKNKVKFQNNQKYVFFYI